MFQKLFPFLQWFPMKANVLRADLIAGVTVALILVPQSMAYAQLAGMPAHYGLYAAFLPVVVAALWGSSSQLSTGPVAIVSLLTASALSLFTLPSSEEFIILSVLLAFMVGVLQIIFGLLRFGVVINFLAHPVIVGFTNAAAIIIALSQVNKIFGISIGKSEHFLVDVWSMLLHIGQTHFPTLFIGIAAILFLVLLKKYVPKAPGTLIVVALLTTLSFFFQFKETYGGKVVGFIPSGLPEFSLPSFEWDMIVRLLPIALTIALVGFMESISVAKAISRKTKETIDSNQEFIGQGLANIAGSISHSFPVSGSFSRSAVNFSSGAKTGMSSVFSAMVVLVTLLFLTPLLYHLPEAVLAAVIMMAVSGLVNIREMKHLWKTNKHDGIVVFVTFVATLLFAPHLDNGILLGGALAIALYLGRISSPSVVECLPDQESSRRQVRPIQEGSPSCQQVQIIRIEGSVFFGAVANIEKKCSQLDRGEAYRVLLCHHINAIDAAGAEFLENEFERLEKKGVQLYFCGLKPAVKEILKRGGYTKRWGKYIVDSKKDVLREILAEVDTVKCHSCPSKIFQECHINEDR